MPVAGKDSATEILQSIRAIAPTLMDHVEEGENSGRLPAPVIGALREAGLYRLFLPKSLGGYELDPLAVARITEAVALHNSAAAWSVMVVNTSSWWCARMPEKGIEKLFERGPESFLAGAFHPPMKATPTEGGYMVNGRSPLVSNIHEAQWIFVTAFLMDGQQVKMNEGRPEMIIVAMKAEDCRIIDTWQSVGMKATDSNDVMAVNVFVPGYLGHPLSPQFEPNKYFGSPLYRYPALGASIGSLITPVALAVARNAIEELKGLASSKIPFGSAVSIRDRGTVQRKLGMAEASLQSSKAFLQQEMEYCWEKTKNNLPISIEERANLLLALTHANQTCLQAVDLMYSAAGTTGIYLRNKLAHYFMDAQVIRHHGFSNESRYETAGQMLMGLEPDLPVVMF